MHRRRLGWPYYPSALRRPLGARTDAAVGYGRRCTLYARLVLRAAVSVRSWDVPSKTVQPMSLQRTAGGVPAACFGVRSRVRWLLERVLPCHTDRSNGGGLKWGARGRQALNPADRYGTVLL
jgi:hypothetical protein